MSRPVFLASVGTLALLLATSKPACANLLSDGAFDTPASINSQSGTYFPLHDPANVGKWWTRSNEWGYNAAGHAEKLLTASGNLIQSIPNPGLGDYRLTFDYRAPLADDDSNLYASIFGLGGVNWYNFNSSDGEGDVDRLVRIEPSLPAASDFAQVALDLTIDQGLVDNYPHLAVQFRQFGANGALVDNAVFAEAGVVPPPPPPANLLSNGDFETPFLTPPTDWVNKNDLLGVWIGQGNQWQPQWTHQPSGGNPDGHARLGTTGAGWGSLIQILENADVLQGLNPLQFDHVGGDHRIIVFGLTQADFDALGNASGFLSLAQNPTTSADYEGAVLLDGFFGAHGAWETVNYDIDFGPGYDYVMVALRGNNAGSLIDNVVLANPAADVIPEPTTLALAGLGLLALCRSRPRRRT